MKYCQALVRSSKSPIRTGAYTKITWLTPPPITVKPLNGLVRTF